MLNEDILPEDSPRMKMLKKRQLELRNRKFKAEHWGLDRYYATRLYKKLLEIKPAQFN